MESPAMAAIATAVPRPAAAVVSTDAKFIEFLKLRLEFVLKGHFAASSLDEALASLG
ncbi:MAG: MgPME-cyclase complex family protein [Prochlorococcaceae cyanobacterium]